jgi:uncharacterized phage protein (TIGR01671 family)
MKILKFRAWDGENMEYFSDLYWFEENYVHENGDGFGVNFHIMQFTGLKDKNGQEIYDGDIIHFTKHSHVVEVGNLLDAAGLREVVILDETQQLGWKGSGYTFCKSNCETICEIIGNIYENPELLKEFNK